MADPAPTDEPAPVGALAGRGGGVDPVADLARRGLVHQLTADDLGARLAAEPVTAYHGIDATAPSLHVGNLLGVLALQRLQRAGQRPVALLGGGTTLIGDPSGKAGERPMREPEEVAANVAGIRAQLERFLDFDTGPNPAVLVDNADWLTPLGLLPFLRDVGKHFTVGTMIAKESVRSRLEAGISFTEFSYMLLQAYDYLHLYDTLGCRLQVGGSDQWGNITAGCELVRRARGAEVWGLTWPLLTKADGTKFGKSEAGNVWLDPARTSPYQFFQFWVRADDRDVVGWLRTFTSLPDERIADLEAEAAADPAARPAQQALAREVTAAVHGEAAAAAARDAAAALFGGDLAALDEAILLDVFADAPASVRPRTDLDGGGTPVVDLLVAAGLVGSRSAARTAVVQGGAYVNNRRVVDADQCITAADLLAGGHVVLRRGKREQHLVRFA